MRGCELFFEKIQSTSWSEQYHLSLKISYLSNTSLMFQIFSPIPSFCVQLPNYPNLIPNALKSFMTKSCTRLQPGNFIIIRL